MKKMNKLSVVALAFAALSLASTGAFAQVSSTASSFVLSFEINDGAGDVGPTDLEVDLPSFNPSVSANLSSLLSATDLSALSSVWANTTPGVGASWSVIGSGSLSSFDATDTQVAKTSASGVNAYANDISNYAASLNGLPSASTTNSTLVGTTSAPASGIGSSYTSYEESASSANNYEGGTLEQTGAGSDELYSVSTAAKVGNKQPSATDLGTFSLTENGNGTASFTYTAVAAAPEPSAYALGICAALLFLVLRRRSQVA